MARAKGLYSNVVAWLKIVLPLVAIALMSMLFLVSRTSEPSADIPFADALAEGEVVRQQVGAPYFAGTTQRGDMISMTAETARPEGDNQVLADDVSATLDLSDGNQVTLTAQLATVHNANKNVELRGGVLIESTNGYSLITDQLVSGIDRIAVETEGAVQGSAPEGEFSAGKMTITTQGENADVHLLFTGGVKLIYDPKNK